MYSLGEVYGLEDESGSDCVICLTEEKAFMLLPCRHLCVCKACFRHIDKCPVCRSAFDNYLQVDPAPPPPPPLPPAAAAAASTAASAVSKGAHQGQLHVAPLQPIRVLPAAGGTVLPV
ncbi:hypothetical protein JKP88DRAFT_238256 [Tribonema minus]|uniref:RING-type domain-containing protein n=1 Tax=Tribonema minus TaxID=303371 RepID=A0A835Z5X0_9STRA|nr:hypothetical protein JKP88DRAFT_238256 [Tribonema minus]